MKHKYNKLSYVVVGLFSFVVLSALIILSSYSYAHENIINIDVAGACTFSTGGGNYSVSMVDGSTEINANNITTSCNDTSGYAIYAVGYSGDSYTGNNTDLINSANNSYNIKTDGSGATASNWKLKFTVVSDATIAGNYGTYQNIPSSFTKVASYNSNTASGIITPHYQINLVGIQQPGTYTGQVKYALVHPNTMVPTYTINYNTNGGSGSMDSETGYSFEDSALSSNTLTPPTGYSFNGWCTVQDTNQTPQTTCSGTTYPDGDDVPANAVVDGGVLNLYAIWTTNQYTCTKQYRLQNADGSWGDYVADGTEQINYGSTCSYSKSVSDYKNSADGTNDAQATISGVMDENNLTLSLDLYRNTFGLTINRNATYVNNASATTEAVHTVNNVPYYRWGQVVDVSALTTSCNGFTGWTQSGTVGIFANTNSATTTFTMNKGATTISANGTKYYLQDLTSASLASLLPDVGYKITACDKRDESEYGVAKQLDGKYWLLDNLLLDIVSVGLNDLIGNTNASNKALSCLKTGSYNGSTCTAPYPSTSVDYFSSENTDTDKSYNIPRIAKDSSISGPCQNANQCTNSDLSWSSTDIADKPYYDENGEPVTVTGMVGVFYNYCATSAGSYCYGNGTSYTGSPSTDPDPNSLIDVKEDICPSGWRLPTASASGEFQTIYDLYNDYGSYQSLQFLSDLSMPRSGWWLYGKAYLNSNNSFWSSTWRDKSSIYYLNTSSSSAPPTINPNFGGSRSLTVISIRCIFKG